MAEPKKEEKPYKVKPTGDYLKIIENYHEPEIQEKVNKKAKDRVSKLNKSIDDFVFGAEANLKKESGERRKLKTGDAAEARNLLHKVVIDHIKRAYGKEMAKEYEKNPDNITTYVDGILSKTGTGMNYEHLISELTALGKGGNLDNLTENTQSRLYTVLNALATEEVKETKEYNEATQSLDRDRHVHHPKVIEWHHDKTGLKPKVSNTIREIIHDHEVWKRGNERYSKDFLTAQENRFHKATVDAYKNKHYSTK